MSETTTPLTTASLTEVVEACMVSTTEAPVENVIVVEGIRNAYVFDARKIEENHEKVHELLLQLPETFQADKGGGWSFLNMCMRADGEQWTGLHMEQEALMCLGEAAGWLWVMHRGMWLSMPGGMPYVAVRAERKPAQVADEATLAQINAEIAEHMLGHSVDEATGQTPDPDLVHVQTRRCVHCGKTGEVVMPRQAFERFEAGEHVQAAWPQGSAGEREQLINGTHPDCFEAMFPPDEED